jgi:hypothetical protein
MLCPLLESLTNIAVEKRRCIRIHARCLRLLLEIVRRVVCSLTGIFTHEMLYIRRYEHMYLSIAPKR